MRKRGFGILISILTVLAFVLVSSLASATTYRMSGTWLQRRGSTNIPLYIVALGNLNGPLLGLGDPHIPGSGFVNVTKAGTGPATITVPAGVFQLNTSRKVPLQHLVGGNVIQVTTMFDLQGPQASGVFKQTGTTARLATNFSFCPGGANNPACGTSQVITGSGTKAGIVKYQAGPHRFGGTMQMLIQGSGEVAVTVGQSPLKIRHDEIAGNSLAPQAQGGAYSVMGTDVLQNAQVTQSAILTSGGLIGTAGPVVSTATPDADVNTGFPWTTGQVRVDVPGGVTTMNAPTTITLTGSDKRTPNGRGSITMVAGGLSHRTVSLLTFGNVDQVHMEIASGQLTPALSPMGFVALGSMLVMGGGYVLRRRF